MSLVKGINQTMTLLYKFVVIILPIFLSYDLTIVLFL